MSFQDYVGRSETRADTVSPLLIRGLAATLDIPEQEAAPGGRRCTICRAACGPAGG